MKAAEIEKCLLCGQGVMHNGGIAFYRVRLQRLVADVGAVRRQAGLEMMLGGNAAIARAMGPDEDMAKPLGDEQSFLVCDACALDPESPTPLMRMAEMVIERAEKAKA